MTQMQLNFTFDLGTAAGRAEFQRMVGHLLSPPGRVDLSDLPPAGPPGEISDAELKELQAAGPTPSRANSSSVPDDPDRAAAALAGRQAAAAKARAAKAAKVGAPGPDTLIEEGAPNGAAEDDLGLVDPNMSPAEAKEAGLALVREAFQAGKIAQVKALQKAWQIAKFYDIPNERGHEFYQQVMKLAHETGLRK